MELQNTKTLTNLMRAMAGETLARSRYELAAEAAEKEKAINDALEHFGMV